MSTFNNWYDYINPGKYVEYVFGDGGKVDDAKKTLGKNKSYWDSNYSANQSMLDDYLTSVSATNSANNKFLQENYGSSISAYNNLLDQYGKRDPYSAGTFSYSGDINSFMSPATALRIKAAQDAITNSQANAGNMFSSDYLNALNAKSQAMASEEYDKAYNRMTADRSMNLNEWNAQNAENRAAYDSESEIYKNLLSLYGTDRNNYINGTISGNNSYLDELGNYYSQVINNNNAYTQGMTNINSSKANADLASDNGWKNLVNTVTGGAKAFSTGA